MATIEYELLRDFSGLPKVRQTCALKTNGIKITNIPLLDLKISKLWADTSPGFKAFKMDFASNSSSNTITEVMKSLHGVSQEVLKNLSHALELPWEKYLGEMHEFTAPSKDQLCIVKSGEVISPEWSTLTLAVNTASPDSASVIYGAALSVFSEGIIPTPSNLDISSSLATNDSISGSGDWIIYYVCPNDDVFYTRAAGALMSPLSCEEYESRERVRDLTVAC